MDTVAAVVEKMGRVAVGPGRHRAGLPDSSIVTAGLRATRHGRHVTVTVDGKPPCAFDLGSTGMARFLFSRLTLVA